MNFPYLYSAKPNVIPPGWTFFTFLCSMCLILCAGVKKTQQVYRHGADHPPTWFTDVFSGRWDSLVLGGAVREVLDGFYITMYNWQVERLVCYDSN